MYPMENNIVNDSQIGDRLQQLLQKPLTPRHLNVVKSFSDFWNKYQYLTTKQVSFLDNIEMNHSDDYEQWRAEFGDDKKELLMMAVNYYQNSQYFTEVVNNYYMDKNYIPTRRQYERMCENKYVKRAIEYYKSEPLYGLGDIVTLRTRYLYRLNNNLTVGIINKIGEPSFLNGTRLYDVMWLGGTEVSKLFEREIKIYRHPKKEKKDGTT